ncbi:MAG: MucB/RseB C-terminal domain-containing protein [Bradyrhizobium sp.]
MPLVAAAAEPDTAAAWFARMQQALSHQSYRGVVVYMGNGAPETYRLIVSRGQYALIGALTGPARQIVRGPNAVVRLLPDGSTMVVRGMSGETSPLPFPPASQIKASALESSYRLQLGGSSRVAGEAAQILDIVPRDQWRYGYRIWIGRDSGLLLRSQLVSSDGQELQQSFFTELQLMPAPAAESAIGAKALALVNDAGVDKNVSDGACAGTGEAAMTFKNLPPGFHVLKTVCERAPGAAAPVTHVLISDGLAVVSLFVAVHHAGGDALIGVTALGAVHAAGRLQGGFALTAMGDAPLATVSRIVHSPVTTGGH